MLKYNTGSFDSIDDNKSPLASYGVEGITIVKPGDEANILSILCE